MTNKDLTQEAAPSLKERVCCLLMLSKHLISLARGLNKKKKILKKIHIFACWYLQICTSIKVI